MSNLVWSDYFDNDREAETGLSNEIYENKVRQLENLEMQVKAQEAYEQSIRGLRLCGDAGGRSDLESRDSVNA